MPELPEVETVVRALRETIIGARLASVEYVSSRISRPNPRGWKAAIAEASIEAVTRRGKYIVLALSNNGHLVMHLRMTGRLRLSSPGHKRGTHDRFILRLDNGSPDGSQSLVLIDTRQFARADWCPRGSMQRHAGLAKLGPEADQVTETLLRRALARSRRPIKSLLLDQTAIAGLGNIYADEALFAAGIHPLTRCDLVDRPRIRRLRLGIRRILDAAIKACGTTFDTFSDLSGEAGGFAPQLNVYQRTGQPCRVCESEIARIVISGRGAHFCPRCQSL